MKRRSGLTLIELTAALALAGLVMMAALGATSAMSRSHRLGVRADQPQVLRDCIQKILTIDILNAQKCRMTPAGFELKTHAALDAATLSLRHLPSTVSYEVRRSGSQTVLIRKQTDEDGKVLAELVSLKAGGISIRLDSAAKTRDENGWKEMQDASEVIVDVPEKEPIRLCLRRK